MIKKLLIILALLLSTLMLLSTSYPTYELDQTYYSLEEIYEVINTPLSSDIPIISTILPGKISKDGFTEKGLITSSDSEKIWNYLITIGILDENGKINDVTNIDFNRSDSNINNIITKFENYRRSNPNYPPGLDSARYAYKDFQRLVVGRLKELHPKFNSSSSYDYYLEKLGGNSIMLNSIYTQNHEYQFDETSTTRAVRYFRDKNNSVKIICSYNFPTQKSPGMSTVRPYNRGYVWMQREISAVFSESTDHVVLDTLTRQDGYIIFDLEEKNRKHTQQYLLIGHYKNHPNYCLFAFISKDIIDPVLKQSFNQNTHLENTEKYFRAEPTGSYLPGSGPGTRPGTGEIIDTYRP